ncbi:MAG: EamA family transporter [Endomicrobiales bacterium]|nr:EamA family transporter [Endomicrobiales bacterium]
MNASISIVVSYFLIYAIWGTTFYFCKVSVETIPPAFVVAARWLLGGAIFACYGVLSGRMRALPGRDDVIAALKMSVFLIVAPSVLFTAAMKSVDSYVAALTCAAAPAVVAIWDLTLFRKKISGIKISGIALGITGVALLLYDGRSVATSVDTYVLMMFAGLLSWSFGTSVGHSMKTSGDSFALTSLQMLFGGFITMVLSVIMEPDAFASFGSFSARSVSAVAYLGVMGSVAFGAYNYLIKHEPAIRVSTNSLVNPVIAVVIGLFIGGESPARYMALGIPVILSGLGLILFGEEVVRYLGEKAKEFVFSDETQPD